MSPPTRSRWPSKARCRTQTWVVITSPAAKGWICATGRSLDPPRAVSSFPLPVPKGACPFEGPGDGLIAEASDNTSARGEGIHRLGCQGE
jgi:hypothetical protein